MKRHLPVILVTALALLNLFPLGYMLWLSAWGKAAETGASAPLGPYLRLADQAPIVARWLGNSFLVATLTVGYHLTAHSMAGYVLAKRRFRERWLIFSIIILALMVPKQVTLIPLFLQFARWGLHDTYWGLILPGLGDVIGIFLMRQFFLSLPDTLIEAARIDGAGEWGVFTRIALPLSIPALGAVAVLGFQHYWSDFFWPLVIVQSSEKLTIQVGLAAMAGSEFGPDLNLMAAGAATAAVPILAIFLVARRWFFMGLRSGAIKG